MFLSGVQNALPGFPACPKHGIGEAGRPLKTCGDDKSFFGGILEIVLGLFCLFAFLFVSCSDINSPGSERDFNVRLRYGVLARNELNTFRNTFTKDLILDGTVTIPFHLLQASLDSIAAKMNQIDFFSYPDTFIVRSQDSIRVSISPNNTYDFRVVSRSTVKTLFWDDAIIASDPQATKLRELVALIKTIVESKPEYQQLPPARGGYI
jgi:hypothetical protein